MSESNLPKKGDKVWWASCGTDAGTNAFVEACTVLSVAPSTYELKIHSSNTTVRVHHETKEQRVFLKCPEAYDWLLKVMKTRVDMARRSLCKREEHLHEWQRKSMIYRNG